jgi:hypothetical protein
VAKKRKFAVSSNSALLLLCIPYFHTLNAIMPRRLYRRPVATALLLQYNLMKNGLMDRTSLPQPPFHAQSQGLIVTDLLPQPYGQEYASFSFVSGIQTNEN